MRRVARPAWRRRLRRALRSARQTFIRCDRFANGRPARALFRCLSLVVLGLSVGHGLHLGGHLSGGAAPTRGLADQISSQLGYAAENIEISGLHYMSAERVLKAIGVVPGDSLLGFDAHKARNILVNLDWVKSARIRVSPPNGLHIALEERTPFAVWQRDGLLFVIDRQGAAMASFDPAQFADLLLVTGEGAQHEVARLVNLLEAYPAIVSRVRAAGRAGERRWTLYLDGQRKVLLPENEPGVALDRLARLDARDGLLSSGIRQIDMRVHGEMVLIPFDGAGSGDGRKVASSLP